MKFKDYLNKKRNIIIFLMCINCFALGVNMLNIRAKLHDSACPDFINHYLLSSGTYGNKSLSKSNFWPFVKYFEFSEGSYYCEAGSKEQFKGVFRYYDFSEFIIYSILIVLGLYIRFELTKKGKKAP